MRVLYLLPPNYRAINAAFDVRGRPVIFTYGDTIFNPAKIKVTPALQAHEAVHSHRQGDNPGEWWERYIEDPEFRLNEEIPAHQAEYREFCRHHADTKRMLHEIARRLSSSLYGKLIDFDEAVSVIECRENYEAHAI